MAADDEPQSKIGVSNVVDWNCNHEVQLFLAMKGHKPVGVAKYFHMACILDKFSSAVKREDISSKVIWDHLESMYDLQALEETETLPFPNEEEEFSLPPPLFGDLLTQKKSVKMLPPPAPSPPPDVKKEDSKDIKKETVKDSSIKKESKELIKKEDKKGNVKDGKKEIKEEPNKKDKKYSKDLQEDRKKEKETYKGKELVSKEPRLNKRASAIRDDEDSSVSSTGSTKKSRDNSDTDDSTPKRTSNIGASKQSANGKGKRQTRFSYAKVSDDSGSNKSISPLTVSSPTPKRRRQV